MTRLVACLVIALVGCTKHPQPAPLYPKGSTPMDWGFKDLETSCEDPDSENYSDERCQ